MDDLLGVGDEVLDRAILDIKREFVSGAGDVRPTRLKYRQWTQMANYEIMVDMEHYKHELSPISLCLQKK